jgi:bifunctional DNase/RNase
VQKIQLEILGLSSSQSQTGSFALVLGEESGNRRLPIIIGMFEAQAIAIEIEKIVPNRPMTHDLFRSFADGFDVRVEEILISDLKEGVFFSKIICSDGLKRVEIDSRPSDAIAIGLRFGVKIYTYENILSEAGIVLSDFEEEIHEEQQEEAELPVKDGIKSFTMEELNKMLNDALGEEDYEKAAKIRDEINQRDQLNKKN